MRTFIAIAIGFGTLPVAIAAVAAFIYLLNLAADRCIPWIYQYTNAYDCGTGIGLFVAVAIVALIGALRIYS